ncbi:MAG TPA: tetratricopeptide repeat protein [Pseudacidobacterium sp.]|nr:tetratricopeptide repeat protein [Pseudacidobacterium sp.]
MQNWTTKAVIAAVLCICTPPSWAQDDAQSLSEQGREALQAGRYPDAERAYQQLERLQPEAAEIHATLGVVYFKEGKFDRAVTELRRAQQLKPSLPQVEALLAMSLSEQGEFQQALPELDKCFHKTADPQLRKMCGLRLERAYVSLHDDTKAVETALALQQAYSEDPEVLYYSSKVFGNEAFLAAQKLFQTSPDSVWGLMAAGEAHESQGDIEEAIRYYREVLNLDPAKPNIHFRIGRALLKVGPQHSAEAAAEFQQELQMDPANANAAYELAEIYREQGEEEQARKYFQQALDHWPDFEEAHVGLAATVMQRNPEVAQQHLRKAIALDPSDSVAWYRLAQVERALGHSEEQKYALAKFTKLKNQGTDHASFHPEVTPQHLDPETGP